MVSVVLRFIKRFAVLIPGIVIAYFSVRDLLPILDKRLPVGLAIFFTYVLAAYVLIPVLIRLGRILVPSQNVPLYCITPDGFASDPLNIALIGSRLQLIRAMQAAGWYIADRRSPQNVAKQIFCILVGRIYPSAPMSSLYLFGRKQDIGFEIPLKDGRGHRHHVRFWATTYQDGNRLSFKSIHWQQRKEQLHGDNLLWVGAASRDVGLSLIRHNAQITHMIDPDTNTERDLIVNQLQDSGSQKVIEVRLGKPYKLINRVWRGSLHSDGIMKVLKLK